jgi:5-formyltetrahydrofolate cyclo-ligase
VNLDSKENLRQHVRREMKTWWADGNLREQASRKFTTHMLDFLQNQSGVWAGFKSLSGEPSLEAVQAGTKVRWVFPRVEKQELSFWAPKNANAFIPGAFGIQEPDPSQSQQIDLSDINGFIIPGLAFDKKGARLGKGKSFYDRALKNYEGIKVGVGFSWQVFENLPTDPWDIFMDVLVTEAGIIQLPQSTLGRR